MSLSIIQRPRHVFQGWECCEIAPTLALAPDPVSHLLQCLGDTQSEFVLDTPRHRRAPMPLGLRRQNRNRPGLRDRQGVASVASVPPSSRSSAVALPLGTLEGGMLVRRKFPLKRPPNSASAASSRNFFQIPRTRILEIDSSSWAYCHQECGLVTAGESIGSSNS